MQKIFAALIAATLAIGTAFAQTPAPVPIVPPSAPSAYHAPAAAAKKIPRKTVPKKHSKKKADKMLPVKKVKPATLRKAVRPRYAATSASKRATKH